MFVLNICSSAPQSPMEVAGSFIMSGRSSSFAGRLQHAPKSKEEPLVPFHCFENLTLLRGELTVESGPTDFGVSGYKRVLAQSVGVGVAERVDELTIVSPEIQSLSEYIDAAMNTEFVAVLAPTTVLVKTINRLAMYLAWTDTALDLLVYDTRSPHHLIRSHYLGVAEIPSGRQPVVWDIYYKQLVDNLPQHGDTAPTLNVVSKVIRRILGRSSLQKVRNED